MQPGSECSEHRWPQCRESGFGGATKAAHKDFHGRTRAYRAGRISVQKMASLLGGFVRGSRKGLDLQPLPLSFVFQMRNETRLCSLAIQSWHAMRQKFGMSSMQSKPAVLTVKAVSQVPNCLQCLHEVFRSMRGWTSSCLAAGFNGTAWLSSRAT